jgi:uncharacterized protein (TIGR02996 family)
LARAADTCARSDVKLSVWQIYAALVAGARNRPPEERAHQALFERFVVFAELRWGIESKGVMYTMDIVRDRLFPALDLETVDLTATETELLGGPEAIAFVRELKRVAAGMSDPAAMSRAATDLMLDGAMRFIVEGEPRWFAGLIADGAPLESDPTWERYYDVFATPERHTLVGRLGYAFTRDHDGPGGNWMGFDAHGRETHRSYRRWPPMPGWYRRDQLRDGEKPLLAEIAERIDDDGPREVYADWLTERGDPRGALIVQQIHRIESDVPPAPHDAWTLEWERGFVEHACFDPPADREDAALWSFLDYADVGMLRTLSIRERHYLSPIVKMLGQATWPNLTSLTLELEHDRTYESWWVAWPDIRRMCERMPALLELAVVGTCVFPELRHPTLETLSVAGTCTIAGCGMVDPVRRGRGLALPKLERLLVMIRSPDFLATELVLDAESVPRLRHLTLHGACGSTENATALSWLAAWPGAPRLATAEIPSIDELDAPYLERAARALANVEISVSRLDGPPAFEARLRAALPRLRVLTTR